MADTLTAQDYKEALHAAMLYVQSTVHDINHKVEIPSPRSVKLLKELTTKHSEAIKAIAASRL